MKPVLLVTAAVLGFAVLAYSQVRDPALEARARALSQQLRCLVCQNETLADSHADLAGDLRERIYQQMADGKSDREIIQYLSDRYGDFVLYRPPLKPRTWLLWFGPLLLLIAGFACLHRSRARLSPSIGEQPLSPAQRRQVRDLLS